MLVSTETGTVSREGELRKAFAELGHDLNDAEVVSKALQLCGLYVLPPNDLAMKWESFFVNEKLAPGSCPTLAMMKRFGEWLQTNSLARPAKQAPQRRTFASRHTPDRELIQGFQHSANKGSGRHATVEASSIASPSTASSTHMLQRKQPSGKIVTHLLPDINVSLCSSQASKEENSHADGDRAEVALISDTTHYRYLNDQVVSRTHVFDDSLLRTSERLAERFGFPKIDSMLAHNDNLFTVARVGVKGNEDSVDELGVFLQSTVSSGQSRIRLDLRSIKSCSLFPGQIIGVEGSNLDGKKLVAHRIFDDARPLRPLSHMDPLPSAKARVLIAAGPYSASEHNLAFHSSALPAVLSIAQAHSAQAIILCGPFVDSQIWESGCSSVPDTSFDTLFEKKLMRPLLASLSELPNAPEIILIPSLRDVHHHAVYPQPPYELPNIQRRGVHLAPNPSLVRVNGLTIGVTSHDVLTDISRVGLNKGDETSHESAVGHLLKQASFYPLYPPPKSLPFDSAQKHRVDLPYVPDVLVVPSKLPQFARITTGAVCINPGFAVDGAAYGSAAMLTLHAAAPETTSTLMRLEVQVLHL